MDDNITKTDSETEEQALAAYMAHKYAREDTHGKFSALDKIGAIRNEILRREKVYPKAIEADKMTPFRADWELNVMRAVMEDYRKALLKNTGKGQ